jgi:hypothetical protein
MTMKKLTSVLLAAVATIGLNMPLVTLAQDKPQTPDDCKRIYAGDDARIKACMDSLKK